MSECKARDVEYSVLAFDFIKLFRKRWYQDYQIIAEFFKTSDQFYGSIMISLWDWSKIITATQICKFDKKSGSTWYWDFWKVKYRF